MNRDKAARNISGKKGVAQALRLPITIHQCP